MHCKFYTYKYNSNDHWLWCILLFRIYILWHSKSTYSYPFYNLNRIGKQKPSQFPSQIFEGEPWRCSNHVMNVAIKSQGVLSLYIFSITPVYKTKFNLILNRLCACCVHKHVFYNSLSRKAITIHEVYTEHNCGFNGFKLVIRLLSAIKRSLLNLIWIWNEVEL